jgi:hypothetical protein
MAWLVSTTLSSRTGIAWRMWLWPQTCLPRQSCWVCAAGRCSLEPPRPHVKLNVAVRLALCALAFYIGWHLLGAVGLVLAGPLAGVAFAGPILNAITGGARLARTLALRPVDGHYYAFHGRSIGVWEDEEESRWLRAIDVRQVLPNLPRDDTLAKILGAGTCVPSQGAGLHIRADSLLDFLSRAEQPGALKFKTWVQREVHFPSGSARRRGLGPTGKMTAANPPDA